MNTTRLLALLISELTPHALYEIVEMANNPKVDEPYNIISEWRYKVFGQYQYLQKERVEKWLSKPLEERVAEVIFALHEAANEEWE